MKLLLDACVLYPTVLREILTGVAGTGAFTPLWSARILEEWARAARRRGGPVEEAEARGAIALLRTRFPAAEVAPRPGTEARLYLPDENDIHVLAAAIAGGADAIVTFNAADFPRGTLRAEGLDRRDPDGLLWEIWSGTPEKVAPVVARVHAEAERLAGETIPLRRLLKRANLPRLGRALEGRAAEG